MWARSRSASRRGAGAGRRGCVRRGAALLSLTGGLPVAVLSHGRSASPAAPHLLRALPPAVAVPGSGPAAAAARRCPGAVKREM